MPRIYKRKDGGNSYKRHSPALLKAALADVGKGMTYRKAARKHKISYSVLYRHNTRNVKKQGGQAILSEVEENEVMIRLIQCAEWGYPVEAADFELYTTNQY